MKDSFGDVNAAAIAEASISELQSFGMTFRKAEYIQDLQKRYKDKELTCSVSPLCRTQTQLKN